MPSIANLVKGNAFLLQIDTSIAGYPTTPERGHVWLVLGGEFYHTTGTHSVFTITMANNDKIFSTSIPKTVATGQYPMFNTNPNPTAFQAQDQLVFITDDMRFNWTGGSGSGVVLHVIDFLG